MIPKYITSGFLTPEEIIYSVKKVIGERKSFIISENLRQIDEDGPARYYMDPSRVMYRDRNQTQTPNQRFLANPSFTLLSNKDAYQKSFENYISYKINPMIWFINEHKVKSLLDPFARWGERLLASVITNIKYVGCDPHILSHESYAALIQGLSPPKRSVVHSQSFEDYVIDESFDMMYLYLLAMPPEDSDDIKVLSAISKAWNNLQEGKRLIVHADQTTKPQLQKITVFLKTQQSEPPTEYSLDKNGELGSVIFSWKKPRITSVGITNSITVKKKIYRAPEGLISLGIPPFLRIMSDVMHYVADIYDSVVHKIANNLYPKTKLIVHLPKTHKIFNLQSPKSVSFHTYDSLFKDELEKVKVTITASNQLIPTNLDSDIFEATLATALKFNLPSKGNNFIEPERIWLSESEPVVIRALLQVWKKAILLIITKGPTETIRSGIPLYERRRVLIYRFPKSHPDEMKNSYGRSTDYIMI